MLKQISVFLPNVPQELSKFLDLLIENTIQLRAITVAENDDYGLILLLVDDPDKCLQLLKEKDFPVSSTEVIAVRLRSEDNARGVQEIAKILGQNQINIGYLYSTLVLNTPLIILKVDDEENAMEILKNDGFELEDRKSF